MRGRQLSRDTEHRKALRRNMAQSLFEHGKIRTTVAKAKEIRPFVEKLITLARRNDLVARRRVIQLMQDRRSPTRTRSSSPTRRAATDRRHAPLQRGAPKFADRQGGYTRIIKLRSTASATRRTWCCSNSAPKSRRRRSARRSAGLRRKRNERRHQFASKPSRAVGEDQAGSRGRGTAPRPTRSRRSSSRRIICKKKRSTCDGRPALFHDRRARPHRPLESSPTLSLPARLC
jgi:large subunit ribosomal protein L17